MIALLDRPLWRVVERQVIVARHMDMRVLGLSIITDTCLPDALEPVDVTRIIEAAGAAEPHLTRLIERVVSQI